MINYKDNQYLEFRRIFRLVDNAEVGVLVPALLAVELLDVLGLVRSYLTFNDL